MVKRFSLPNPYTNRAAIRSSNHFFGRELDLRDIYTRIAGGQSVMITGERRIGKSSLLNAIGFSREEYELDPGFGFILLDMQSIAGCTEEAFVENLLTLISREMGIALPEMGRRTLEDAAERIHSHGRRLIIALDEFDVLVWNEKISPEFLVVLRSWTVRHGFPFVVAFREGSIDRIVSDEKFGSAFLNLFGSVYVGPLREEEARELIRTPARNHDVEFTDEEVEMVLDIAGYFPLYIQIACYHLFEFKKLGKTAEEIAVQLPRSFAFEASPHFEYMWWRLSPREQEALRWWVKAGNTEDMAAEKDLLMKGLLIEERRAIRISCSLLGEWMDKWEAPAKTVRQTVRDALLM
ncbi:AAA+ ATPase superfamily predicted ATPase [Edaphobacter aggregans]|uniref:AAA+ ATPase superfamily predicted ATPase n=1 Tax=Edaphobacter aggregans TaxID=570835 RepID=A0A428MND6_9BACT|nr:ATP-binding protein [Edaphobacter aggregans]RSL18362.1 AAA+ ATPase superfamily predicted ATPase [Edaphobacter aggregans]